jgi:hypothetical protein
MLDKCPQCSKYTLEVDDIAHIWRCLNTKCLYVRYGSKSITPEQVDEIGDGYRLYSRKLSKAYKPFSQYLRELSELGG